MRNNNSKNQSNQFPAKLGGAKNVKSSILVRELTKSRIEWPDMENPDLKFKVRVVRTTIYHSNGQVSNMIMYMPDYTMYITCHEEAVDAMNEYINYLASTWIGVDKYHTQYGILDENGTFKESIIPYRGAMETVIKKGSVYIPGTKGKWISRFASLRLKVEEKRKRYEGSQKGGASC